VPAVSDINLHFNTLELLITRLVDALEKSRTVGMLSQDATKSQRQVFDSTLTISTTGPADVYVQFICIYAEKSPAGSLVIHSSL